MLLTISKRFEFSASRRLSSPHLDPATAREHFGREAEARYGSGRNYAAIMVFSGPVDERTGMVVNLSDIKAAMKDLLDRRYDHRFLNADTPPFDQLVPTPEHVARQLLDDATPLFVDQPARPVACHLVESAGRAATAYRGGQVDSHHWVEFSAARRTMSPHLSDEENRERFGIATGDHGHHYRLRVTLAGPADANTGLVVPRPLVRRALAAVHDDLDHRHLNDDVLALAGRPVTTESLARWLHERLAVDLPVERVRLHERPDFFADHHRAGATCLAMRRTFDAAHRLHSPRLDDDENLAVYQKCNNPSGHGHRYQVEATLAGIYDERSGTCGDFVALRDAIDGAVTPWRDRHLDWETDDFRDRPSTSENIVHALWPGLDARLDGRLARLRLRETFNNRFALRRDDACGALTKG